MDSLFGEVGEQNHGFFNQYAFASVKFIQNQLFCIPIVSVGGQKCQNDTFMHHVLQGLAKILSECLGKKR